METDFSKALQGFEQVWRRVQQQKPRQEERGKAAPRKQKPSSRANRFNPGRR